MPIDDEDEAFQTGVADQFHSVLRDVQDRTFSAIFEEFEQKAKHVLQNDLWPPESRKNPHKEGSEKHFSWQILDKGLRIKRQIQEREVDLFAGEVLDLGLELLRIEVLGRFGEYIDVGLKVVGGGIKGKKIEFGDEEEIRRRQALIVEIYNKIRPTQRTNQDAYKAVSDRLNIIGHASSESTIRRAIKNPKN